MTEGNRPQVLTDAQWELLAPRIAACRPRHKAEPHDLRRTIEAIIWRHDHGAKWRQIPAELGPWWMAAQTFSRWSRLGAWERMLGLAQQRGGVAAGRLGANAGAGATAWRGRGRDGWPRRHQHPSAPQATIKAFHYPDLEALQAHVLAF